MPIQYDGNSIIRHNSINYESYHDYMDRSSKESERTSRAMRMAMARKSRSAWLADQPRQFRQASIQSIGEHDPKAMRALESAVEQSKSTGSPCSLIIGSKSEDMGRDTVNPKGKTWAIYAYIKALIDADIIIDPAAEVAMTDEVSILDGYTDWKNATLSKTRRTLFEGRRLVVIDDINSDAGMMKRNKYGKDAWSRFAADASRNANGCGIIVAFSGDYDDMSLQPVKEALRKIMSGAKVVLLERGVAN